MFCFVNNFLLASVHNTELHKGEREIERETERERNRETSPYQKRPVKEDHHPGKREACKPQKREAVRGVFLVKPGRVTERRSS